MNDKTFALLDRDRQPEPADVAVPARAGRTWRKNAMLAGMMTLAGALAIGGYWYAKSLERQQRPMPSMGSAAPWKGAPASAPEQQHALSSDHISAMAERLRARLAQQPGNAEGWAMLGRTYAMMGKPAEAVPALEKAAALRPDDAVLLADYADALALAKGRNFEGEPLKLIERALKIAPDNLKALSMAGTAAFNRKDFSQALRYWDKLVQAAPPDSVFVNQVRPDIEQARSQLKPRTATLAGK